MKTPKPFAAFLEGNPEPPHTSRGGRACTTCSLEHVELLNAACFDLARRRALPPEDDESTEWTWLDFFRAYVVPQFPGFTKSDPRRFIRHVEACLGIER